MIFYFSRIKIFYLQLLLEIIFFAGCVPYKYSTETYVVQPHLCLTQEEWALFYTHQDEALAHWLYTIIPRHHYQIRWYDFPHWCCWALFGNDDQGVFAEAQFPLFEPQQKIGIGKALKWMVRNPLHNFCYYVIGSADCQNDEWTILKLNRKQFKFLQYKKNADTVFGGKYTSFFFGFHNGKPLISLRLAYSEKWRSDFYIGWRERGNFGLKFLPLTKNSLVVWENLNYKD